MSKRRNHDVVFKARVAQQWKKPLLECRRHVRAGWQSGSDGQDW